MLRQQQQPLVEQEGPQEPQFAPKYDREQTRKLISTYDKNPAAYAQYLEDIRAHANYHNLPFYEGDFSIIEALKQAGGGFIEGFTTLKAADPPDNEYEAIFRNIGHLAGFAPGIMSAPLRGLATLTKSKAMVDAARMAQALGDKSVPMLGAKYLTKGAKKILRPALKASSKSRYQAMDTASKYLLGEQAKHIAEGAFHLGSASAISSVWDGVDTMIESFFGGAVAGGVFRGIGNIVGHGDNYLMKTGSKQAEKFVRGLSGSLFMGIPATMRGATTPEQIYEYLMGAYFGGKEMPWFMAKARKNVAKMAEISSGKGENAVKMAIESDPSLLPGWEKMPELVKKHTKQLVESNMTGTIEENIGKQHMLIKELGLLEQIPEKEIQKKGYDAAYPKLYEVLKEGVTESGQVLDKSGFMGVSGAAGGADTYFAHLLGQAGKPSLHYFGVDKQADFARRHRKGVGHKGTLPEGTKVLKSVPRVMIEKELLKNTTEVERAAVNLKKNYPTNEQTRNNMLRNAEIVKKSSKIYAIGEILDNNITKKSEKKWAADNPGLHNRVVSGGTGWTVQMAINKIKPVYVFDQRPNKNSWYFYDYKAPGGGRFVAMKGTPDLAKRPGLIGTQGITGKGKKAAKELIAKAFPEDFPGVAPRTKSPIIGAVEEKILKTHPETQKQLSQKVIEFTDINKEIIDRQKIIKEGKIDKLRKKDLKSQIKNLKKDRKKLENDMKVLLRYRENEYWDAKLDRIVTEQTLAVDTGSALDRVDMNSQGFVEKYLKPFWKDNTSSVYERDEMKAQRAIQIRQFITQFTDKGSKTTRIDELVNAVENEFDPISLPREAIGRLKQLLRKNNQGELVRYVQTMGNRIRISHKDHPKSYAGKSKEVVQPFTILDEVYKASSTTVKVDKIKADKINKAITKKFEKYVREPNWSPNAGKDIIRKGDFFIDRNPKSPTYLQDLYIPEHAKRDFAGAGKLHKGKEFYYNETADRFEIRGKKKADDAVIIWDEVTSIEDKSYNDIPLNKYYGHLLKNNYYNEKTANKKFNEKIAQMMDWMYKEQDMVPFGGIGDKGRIVFVKEHPNSAAKSKAQVNNMITKALSIIKKHKIRDEKGKEISIDTKVNDKYNKSKKRYIRKYGKDKASQFERAYLSNILFDMEMNGYLTDTMSNFSKNFKLSLGKHPKDFIPSAVAFNKRAQIWLNPFFSGDRSFYKGKGLGMTQRGNLSYALIGDPKETKTKTILEALNIELPEHVDGAILVRPDVLDIILQDAGLPAGGQNKSFIVSKGEVDKNKNPLGTLLGKYMMHDIGPIAEAQMKKQGIHMMIMTSSAKQIGNRLASDYHVSNKGKLTFDRGTKTYELNPEHIMFSPSTFGKKEMLEPQKLVKQLFTNFQQYGDKTIKPEVIQDLFDSVIGEKVRGTEEGNKILQSYLRDFKSDKLDTVFRNIDKIGIDELIKASKVPGAEAFSSKLFKRMLTKNIENVEQMVREGEMTAEEGLAARDEMIDFKTSTDRILNIGADMIEARTDKLTGFPVFYHKFVKDYRNIVMHNWVRNAVTTPTIKNSSIAFMRPFDKFLQADPKYKELKTKDDIFFLDKAYEDLEINLAHTINNKEKISLLELWDTYQNKKLTPKMKEYIEDVFEAVALRVPMDSMSGAQKLKFRGFTDREGHGILLHSRTMRALGGADLDGDEAFIYFGGRTESGLGQGMKKSWKDAIHAQKEEYYTGGVELPKIKVAYDSNIKSAVSDRFVSAQSDFTNNIIKIDPNKLILDFKNKVWTKPKVIGVKPLPEDAFKTQQEWESFVIRHERAHFLPENKAIKNLAKRENHANDIALKKGRDISHNKKSPINRPDDKYKGKFNTFADLFTKGGELPKDLKASKTLFYSPEARLSSSREAYEGREMLSLAASSSQVMKSTYNLIRDSKEKIDSFEATRWDKYNQKAVPVRVVIEPRTGKEWRRYQRELIRAQIAFGADPLDEGGIKSADFFFKELHDAHFKTSILEKVGKKWKKNPFLTLNALKAHQLKDGMYGIVDSMNKANFGKNWMKNRNWTFQERQKMNEGLLNYEDPVNVILPKMAETMRGIDYSDHIYKRINIDKLTKTYAKMEEYVKDLDWLQGPMQRSSFRVKHNDEIEVITRNYGTKEKPIYLFEKNVIEALANDKTQGSITRFMNAIKGTTWAKRLQRKEEKAKLWNSEYKEKILREVVADAENYLLQDMINMASVINTKNIVQKHNISPNRISDIHKQSEVIKDMSFMNMKNRMNLKLEDEISKGSKMTEALQKQYDEWVKLIYGATKSKIPLPEVRKRLGEKVSAISDQIEIDKQIKDYKSKLSKGEKELFDNFLIGSLNRGNFTKVEKVFNMLEKTMRKKDDAVWDLFRKLRRDASKTHLTRVGFDSKSVDNSSIRQHLKTINNLWGESWERPLNSEEVIKKTTDAFNTKEVTMADGTKEAGYYGTKYQRDHIVEEGLTNKGFAGIRKGKTELSREDKDMIVELSGYLKENNEYVTRDLNGMLLGITEKLYDRPKDFNTFNKQDFKNVLNYFRDIKAGTFMQRLMKDKSPEIKARYYHMFPESIDRELMRYDIEWLEKKGLVTTKEGKVEERTIRQPTQFINILMEQINKTGGLAVSKSEQMVTENKNDFLFLEEIDVGSKMFDYAVLSREMGMHKHIDKSDKPDAIKLMEKKSYSDMLKQAKKNLDWDNVANKEYVVTNDKGERVTLTGKQIVDGSDVNNFTGIKKRINVKMEKLYKSIAGDREWMVKQGYISSQEYTDKQLKVDWRKFVADVKTLFRTGTEDDMSNLMENVGIDGMRHIAKQMIIDLSPADKKADIAKWPIFNTGKIDFNTYWPHMFFSKTSAEKSMKNAIKRINEDPLMTQTEKDNEIQKITFRHKSLTGDWEFQDMQLWDRVERMSVEDTLTEIAKAKKQKLDKIDWQYNNQRIGSMNSRTSHIPGWSTDISVMDAYSRNLSNTFFKHLQQILARETINTAYNGKSGGYEGMRKKFGKFKDGQKLALRWKRFLDMYVQGAIGNPEVIPDDLYKDAGMKIKGTPYAWWADNRVRDRVNSIAKQLGVNKKDLPEELKKFGYNDIRDWSNMEAKWELASLLAHPKSSVTNIFGGSIHTIENVGFGAFLKGRSIKFLKRINPEWNTLKDVEKWVIEKGVLPSFLVHELGLNSQFKGKNVEKIVEDLTKALVGKDKIDRKSIREIAQKNALTESAVDFASKFMSVPERMLRRDAFMAHYVRAWQRFGGAIKDPNHPFLIEMAKKGVKATQFLYDAPNRPMFARSALGKVMTRFQLFAWNSVRLRNEILRQAKIQGFTHGEAKDRFVRMMQIDLFVLALGNMFMYSLFDNALPPPWNWFQDTADWLFGDEKERDKAFYGALPRAIAPLQIGMPPITRGAISGLQQWIRDDYSKFTDYQIWTMFPFGRMGRDIFHPQQGLVNNPSRFMEKTTGLPIHDISRQRREAKEDKEAGKTYSPPKPGVKF